MVDGWLKQVSTGHIDVVVRELLTLHYDPVYLQPMRRNFKHYEQAKIISPADHSEQAMDELARLMIRDSPTVAARVTEETS